MRGLGRSFAVILAVLTAALVFAASALAAASISVTFVRHAESQANADGIINTRVPGPNITDPVGKQQAIDIAAALAGNGYDGIYASDMVRTQQTAAPLAALLDKDVTILPGLHEIDAGVYEGSSEDTGLGRLGYALSPALWMLGLRFVPMPGSTDSDGNVFQQRVSDAIQTIYDSGDQNPIAFSHGATIMFWTMMNVRNPDLGLLFTHQLNNTSVVVIDGNPQDGWTLVNWDGVAVDADPSFGTKLFVNVRNLIVAPQEAAYAVGRALASGSLLDAATEFVKAVVHVAWAPVQFVASVVGDAIHEVFKPAATSSVTTTVAGTAARLSAVPDPDTTDPDVARSKPSGDSTSRTPLNDLKDAVNKDEQPQNETPTGAAPSTTDAKPDVDPTDAEVEDDSADQNETVTADDAVGDTAAADTKADETGADDQAPTGSDSTDESPAGGTVSDTPADHAQAAAA